SISWLALPLGRNKLARITSGNLHFIGCSNIPLQNLAVARKLFGNVEHLLELVEVSLVGVRPKHLDPFGIVLVEGIRQLNFDQVLDCCLVLLAQTGGGGFACAVRFRPFFGLWRRLTPHADKYRDLLRHPASLTTLGATRRCKLV